MIRHLVMWRFQNHVSRVEMVQHGLKIKQDIEALQTVIDGVVSLKVVIDVENTSNREVLLDSVFTSAEALANYQVHPAHVAVAKFVGSLTADRACIDYVFDDESV